MISPENQEKVISSWEFLDRKGRGVLTDWALDGLQRRKLRRKLGYLYRFTREVAEGTVLFHVGDGIWELEVKGNVQLRPRACFGPRFPKRQVTFLARAIKRDGKLQPEKRRATEIALENLQVLKKDLANRTRQVWPERTSDRT